MTPLRFRDRLGDFFQIEPLGDYVDPRALGESCMRLDGRWYRLTWTPPVGGDPVDAWDASVLQERLLAPLLGIADPRTDGRIAFIGGRQGVETLKRRVDGGQYAVGFAMRPVTVDQIMAVADQGCCLPPKSTWFEPKLRSGLLVHAF